MPEIVGRSFWAFTVSTKLVEAYPKAASVTHTVIVADPVRFGGGVKVRLRLEVVPLKTIVLVGNKSESEEIAPSTRFVTAASSLTVIGMVMGVSSEVL